MKDCSLHPRFLEAGLVKTTGTRTVKCAHCEKRLLTKRASKIRVGDLPEVAVELEISRHDLEHNTKDGTWTGYPDERYNIGGYTLFKHGNTFEFTLDGARVPRATHMEEFFKLFTVLLQIHRGDEEFQFMVGFRETRELSNGRCFVV